MIFLMTPLHALRANPHFAPLFAHVHALCWPILWWSLNRLLRWYASSGYEEVLYGTTPWGYVYIAWLGDRKPDPSAYRPYELERPRWDDPVWSTNLPAPFLIVGQILRSGGLRGSEIAPRFPEQGWPLRGQTEGACALTFLDTS